MKSMIKILLLYINASDVLKQSRTIFSRLPLIKQDKLQYIFVIIYKCKKFLSVYPKVYVVMRVTVKHPSVNGRNPKKEITSCHNFLLWVSPAETLIINLIAYCIYIYCVSRVNFA